MNIVIAAISAGAVGVAVVFVGLFALVSRRSGIGRKADRVQATDPALAAELRGVQGAIDRGRFGRIF